MAIQDKTAKVNSGGIITICTNCGAEITADSFIGTEFTIDGIICKDCAQINFLRHG